MARLLWALPIIILVLLVVPFRVQLTFCAGLEWQTKLKLTWAFWTVGRRGRRKQQDNRVEQNELDRKEKGRTKRIRLKPVEIYQLGSKYIPRLWHALHLRCEYLDIDVLFADPAMLGYTAAICGMNDWPKRPVSLSIGMADELAFDLDGCLQANLYPMEWIALLLRIAFEPPVRQLWWRKRKGEAKNARPKDSGRATGKPHLQQDSHR